MQAITESGYVLNNNINWQVSSLPVHNNYYKRIDNPLVLCEENGDRISFHCTEYAVYQNLPPQYELSICFCKNGKWWDLKVYSVNQDLFTKETIQELEEQLVNMFLKL